MPKMTADELRAGLAGFHGTSAYHRVTLSRAFVATDGVRWLCENANCFWLMDLIMSYQPECRKDPRLREIQFWRITLDTREDGRKYGSARVTCYYDKDEPAFSQDVPATDFPLDAFDLYVEPAEDLMVCMLPGER